MILKLLNNQIRRAFSNSAIHYEVLAGMQYEIGRELVKKLDWDEDCENILDVGMGTGKLTNRMTHLCPGAKVIGLDFADGMVQEAKKKYETFEIVQANAVALPFGEANFDAVLSNLAYQWVDNLPAAFVEARRVLKPNGKFCATLFGQQTLNELFTSLEIISDQDNKRIKLQRLRDYGTVNQAVMDAGFKNVEVRSEITKTHFDDMHSLLKWLKLIGANRISQNYYFGLRYLTKVAEYYKNQFKGRWGVVASFEVIWVKGTK